MASSKRSDGAGTFEFIRGHWYVKVSLPDKTRPRYRLCKDVCMCVTMTEARRLETGAAISERERARVRVELGEREAQLGPRTTIRQFGEDWTKGKLHKRWPDHIKDKSSKKQDGQRLEKHVYPWVEHVAIADFRIEDAERVMSKLPAGLSSATRRHVAQLMHRLMAMAVYPARLRAANPLPKGFMPKVKRTKAFSYLYPSEDAALMAFDKQSSEVDPSSRVDLGERLLFGFLAREGMRLGEALALEWKDLDLQRGAVRLDVNKTDDARAWALGEDVAEALRRWWAYCGSPKAGAVFRSTDGRAISDAHLADRLREALELAGVTRAELHERSAVRRPIRVHDLRATFVTLALATGRSETWVADRTGHRSSFMINRYRRAARTATELGLGWLTPLHNALPELKALANVRTLTTAG
jgi:integrase